jgi:hypothetical protein
MRSGRFLYRKIERTDERVDVYDALAVVTGRAHVEAVVSGHELVADVRYTSVWTKDAQGCPELADRKPTTPEPRAVPRIVGGSQRDVVRVDNRPWKTPFPRCRSIDRRLLVGCPSWAQAGP